MAAKLPTLSLIVACLGLLAGCGCRVDQPVQAPTPANAPSEPAADETEPPTGTMEPTDEGRDVAETTGEERPVDEPAPPRVLVGHDADVAAAELGIAIYPGAHVLPEGGSLKGEAHETAIMTTPDPYSQVARFYRNQYAAGAMAVRETDRRLVIQTSAEQAILSIVVEDDPAGEGTRITLTRLRT